jgi:predicted molibdopterin-dependent oxidoreductase YjgC
MSNSIADIRHADCIFVIGSNTTENHPVIALEVKAAVRQGKAKLIVADPRRIELADIAHLWLQHQPGTDVALINGMLNVIFSKGWFNRAFVEQRTQDVETLSDSVRDYTPEAVEKITGVPANDIVEAARIYAQSPNSSILYAMGITQHNTGTNNVLALANLSMVTGQIGKPFSGLNPLRGQNNVQGACDMGGLPNVYTGYQRVDNDAAREKFEKAWGVPLSPRVGLTLMEMMKGIADGKIKALFFRRPLSWPTWFFPVSVSRRRTGPSPTRSEGFRGSERPLSRLETAGLTGRSSVTFRHAWVIR